MEKTPIFTVRHRAVTYYAHLTTGTTHGMIGIPAQFKDPLDIRKGSHVARLRGYVHHGTVEIFPASDPPAPYDGPCEKVVKVRVTNTNLFIKLPSDVMTFLNIQPHTHEVNWTYWSDSSLTGEIVQRKKI